MKTDAEKTMQTGAAQTDVVQTDIVPTGVVQTDTVQTDAEQTEAKKPKKPGRLVLKARKLTHKCGVISRSRRSFEQFVAAQP
jgi:hypothetical protein